MVRKKNEFDPESAFKSIIEGAGAAPETQKEIKKRISLAVYPSSYSDLQKIAYVNRRSASDIITELIAEYVSNNIEKLEEYDRIKKI